VLRFKLKVLGEIKELQTVICALNPSLRLFAVESISSSRHHLFQLVCIIGIDYFSPKSEVFLDFLYQGAADYPYLFWALQRQEGGQ
jgi:hypothetical protein